MSEPGLGFFTATWRETNPSQGPYPHETLFCLHKVMASSSRASASGATGAPASLFLGGITRVSFRTFPKNDFYQKMEWEKAVDTRPYMRFQLSI